MFGHTLVERGHAALCNKLALPGRGDSSGNAMAEITDALLPERRELTRRLSEKIYAPSNCSRWNTWSGSKLRLPWPLGRLLSAEAEANYHEQLTGQAIPDRLTLVGPLQAKAVRMHVKLWWKY